MSTTSEVGWDDAPKVPRRTFLIGSVSAVAVGGAGAVAVALAARAKSHPDRDLRPVCMAMHVHASASEGPGSMEAQLTQAANTGVDVLWWTEHDFRMSAHDAAEEVHCSALHESTADVHEWVWSPSTFGDLKASTALFCTPATHPLLGTRKSAMLLDVTASSSALARRVMSGQSGNLLNRTSLSGQSIQLEVYPTDISQTAFMSVELTTSFRPSRAGTPAADYVLTYRVGGAQQPGSTVLLSPTQAVVTVTAPTGRWTTLTLDPENDLGRVWPGVNGADASLFKFALAAGARGKGKKAAAYFSNVRFERTASGQSPLATQRRLISFYEDKFPTVKQFQALEVSLTTPHLGWYGGDVSLPDYAGAGPNPSQDEGVALAAVHNIHSKGGLASYCHPFGTATGQLSAAKQETARQTKSAELITNRALGCELLEVGYRLRGGCNLDQHESVWDNCSRNEIFLTGIGVNDDHKGQDWSGELLNFATWAWAPDQEVKSLLSALRMGRVYFGDIARFHGQLDLRLDDRPAMGTVSVGSANSKRLSILASELPAGGTVEVRRGLVDRAGPGDTAPKITVEALAASAFGADGEKSISVDTRTSCFVRVVIKDAHGLPIAFSNPVWLLQATPQHGIPAPRRVAA